MIFKKNFSSLDKIAIITSAALPMIGNKIKPIKVLLNPEDSAIPLIESTKYSADKAAIKVTTTNKANTVLRDN